MADNVFFVEPKRDGTSSGQGYGSQVPPQPTESAAAFSTANAGDFEEITDDSDMLPF